MGSKKERRWRSAFPWPPPPRAEIDRRFVEQPFSIVQRSVVWRVIPIDRVARGVQPAYFAILLLDNNVDVSAMAGKMLDPRGRSVAYYDDGPTFGPAFGRRTALAMTKTRSRNENEAILSPRDAHWTQGSVLLRQTTRRRSCVVFGRSLSSAGGTGGRVPP
jgi:hypothetical protein